MQQMAAAAVVLSTPSMLVCGPAWASTAPPRPRLPLPAVQMALDAALAKVITKGKAPVALRLAFHDAGPFNRAAGDGGMNASIKFEFDRPESFGLKRGWRLILEVRGGRVRVLPEFD